MSRLKRSSARTGFLDSNTTSDEFRKNSCNAEIEPIVFNDNNSKFEIEKDQTSDLIPCFKPTSRRLFRLNKQSPRPVEIKPSIEPEPVQPIVEGSRLNLMRVIGEAFKTYILVEQGKKLLIIDKACRTRRMLFEKFKASRDGIETQMLLAP